MHDIHRTTGRRRLIRPLAWGFGILVTVPVVIPAQAHREIGHQLIGTGLDTSVKAGDDFFAYANGGWLKATTIPAGRDRWGARDEINEINRGRITKLFDDARSAPPGSTARKIADFREAYLDEPAIEAMGLAPLRALLENIDRVGDRSALVRLFGSEMRADVDPLNFGVYNSATVLGLSVERSIHGEENYVPFLVQGGLGLPDRDLYSSMDTAAVALRARYRQYISKMLGLAGFDDAERRAEAVMELETALAQSHVTAEESANDHNADNVWTRADFAREAPGMNWSEFFDAAGLGNQQSLVAWQPTAVRGLASLVASAPVNSWKDYLRFHVIDRYADVLPRSFAQEALAMHGGHAPPSRDQRALAASQTALSEAVGRIYAESYFPPGQKARVREIVRNVASAFAHRAENAQWMSPATRRTALAKLSALYVGIGYPDRWEDYSDLLVDAHDPIGNLRRVSDRDHRQAVARIGKPIDRTAWLIEPQTAGAILVFEQNAYDFAAALLQIPKFDPDASDAAAYGAIGTVIGHDVTHFVDMLGAQYDLDGRTRRWWTADDSVRFQAVAAPLDAQFSAYHPQSGLAVDGKLTQTENVADLGGLVAALDAYHATLGKKISDRNYVRQRDREFFIAFARSWRAKMNDAGMRKQLTNDHAPENYRVATVRNLDAWYAAFDVRPGDSLYVEPAARVHIW